MIDAERLLDWQFPEVVQSYSEDDCIRYALALNVGRDPVDELRLRFTCEREGRPVQALPTMAVVLGFPGIWMADPATGITYSHIVHVEERIRWYSTAAVFQCGRKPDTPAQSSSAVSSADSNDAGRGAGEQPGRHHHRRLRRGCCRGVGAG